jgi:drug/metabolite transporter (DMT)-like permease
VSAVVLALVSAALFGGMTVALRLGLRRGDASTGAVAVVLVAFAVSAVAALARHDPRGAWPFLVIGLFVPGASQLLFTYAIREVGASRTSVAVGSAPLVAVSLALVFLDEPLRAPLAVGAFLVVAGGVLLAAERGRPEHLRPLGLAFAVGATVLFAVRDDVVRALHAHAAPETAGAATLAAASVTALVYARRLPGRRDFAAFWPAGLCFGLSYVCLFEAYFRGRVSVVSPLVATESLWGVGLSLLLFRHAEGVGRRLVLGAALVVAGGALIGATR